MISYLTGATGPYLEDGTAHARNIGLLIQPGNRYDTRVANHPYWAADNGAFSRKGGFNAAKFRTMLWRPDLHIPANKAKCAFVVAPDKLVVLPNGDVAGDARGTLEQFGEWAREIKGMGFPVALVAQDGLEHMLDDVPWTLVDVLFLGGSTAWKLGEGAHACVRFAQRHGKRTHMGRVNSYKRLKIANDWGVDTADGTFLAFGPTKNMPRLLDWLDKLGGGTNGEGVLGGANQRVLGPGSSRLEARCDGNPTQMPVVRVKPHGPRLSWDRVAELRHYYQRRPVSDSGMRGSAGQRVPFELGHGHGGQVRVGAWATCGSVWLPPRAEPVAAVSL